MINRYPGKATVVLSLFIAGAHALQAQQAPRCGGVHQDEASGFIVFPQDHLYCPTLADPKEARTFASFLRGEFHTLSDPSASSATDIVSVGLGDSFGLLRWGGSRAGDGVQIDLAGSVFAQFDLGTASIDLINADYIVGLPVTIRSGRLGMRFRLYHQSSHLGDEYLLRPGEMQRESLSFESLEVMLSRDIGPLRAYGGGEVVVRRTPRSLGTRLLHGGLELSSVALRGVRVVAGLDIKSSDEQSWSPAWSGRTGIELARSVPSGHPVRLVQLLLEVYSGPSPYGQFFQDDISYIGFGVHFGL